MLLVCAYIDCKGGDWFVTRALQYILQIKNKIINTHRTAFYVAFNIKQHLNGFCNNLLLCCKVSHIL